MKLVGLTGGIGSGKTTVLNKFKQLDVPCFITDIEAKKLYDDPAVVEELRATFSEVSMDSIIDADGKVDRKALGKFVFNDEYCLYKLNNLIHPKVRKKFFEWCYKVHDENPYQPYVIIESAIMYETHLDQYLDKVIVAYLDREERIKRTALRDSATREQIEARMMRQMPDEDKVERADFIVHTYEGNPLTKQVELIDKALRQKFIERDKYDFVIVKAK